ncbi:ATP-dependent DNA helicase [Celerinatantimonas sp. MCCC 1A17872]|uniref:ATP-dependent DNA helicase n=1 Tax=Celerinatantimonas sp. MCCC 1A17872 TaxID=3177514 RepID=UPI0038C108CA
MKEDYFAPEGLLAKNIVGFSPRKAQQKMAQAVSDVLKRKKILLVEAGTGTGKTFAYLVPALHSDQQIVISTGSKALQDQLFHKDLPTMVKALGYSRPVALLKGRNNYLCIERLSHFMQQSRDMDKQLLADLARVRQWSVTSADGDISELGPLAEKSELLPLITSTNDNCLGRECPSYSDCPLVKARNRAMQAQIIVINHHLFFADMAVKETGFGELLPQADAYIFDEAHQLPDIATQYFGQTFSSRMISDLCKDIELLYRTELKDMAQLAKAGAKLRVSAQDTRLAFEGEKERGDWRPLLNKPKFSQQLKRLTDDLQFVYELLKLALSRSELGDHLFERVAQLQVLLEKMQNTQVTGFSYWYDTSRLHFSLNITPLNIAERFRKELDERDASWIFTSATLAVNQGFDHFVSQLGVDGSEQLMLESPFDFSHQALLCVPRYLPDPGSPGFEKVIVQKLLPIIEKNGGRCFFLCTSHAMIQRLSGLLHEKTTLPVLTQGEAAKGILLNQFIKAGNAILVATGSFWEGVDVRGQALSFVVIDKIPFASPDDPLMRAKSEDCRLRGGDPFQQVYLPQAAITLKQGVGRLIRDTSDRGVVVICDNRMVNRHYGQLFLQSLPPMRRSRDLELVEQFVSQMNHAENSAISDVNS